MVRQRLILILVIMALAMAMPCNAMAATVYEDGNISTSYITYFRDIVSSVPWFDNYVFFRSSQYDYTMYVGDIDLTGTVFTCDDAVIYNINTGSGYNSTYSYVVSSGNVFVDAGNKMVYSNLGNYPDLLSRGDYVETITSILFFVALLMYLVHSIFYSVRK